MPSVGMVGKNGHDMVQAFLCMSKGTVNCYHITAGRQLDLGFDVIIAAEASPVLSEIIPHMKPEDYLVINADDKDIFPYLDGYGAQLVTYGFNNKACITASSVSDDTIQVCIQRAFTSLNGANHTPQEFATPTLAQERPMCPETTLAAAAAWTICCKN